MAIVFKGTFNSNANEYISGTTGTETSVTYLDGMNGKTAVFNGTSSKIIFGNNSGIQINSLTVTVIFKLGATSGANQIIVIKDTSVTRNLWELYRISGTNNVSLLIYNGTTYLTPSYTCTQGVWYIATFKIQSGGTCSLYINGNLIGSVNIGTITAPTSGLGLSCDVVFNQNSGYLNGYIDDLEINNNILGEGVIKNKYLFYKGFI